MKEFGKEFAGYQEDDDMDPELADLYKKAAKGDDDDDVDMSDAALMRELGDIAKDEGLSEDDEDDSEAAGKKL